MAEAKALFVFDLDGTLYDTASSFLPTMNQVYREYAVEVPEDSTLLSMVGDPFPSFVQWLLTQGFAADAATLAARIAELEIASIPVRGRLYPEVKETLQALRARGIRIALCTNADRHYTGTILDAFALSPLFDGVSTHPGGSGTKTERLHDLIESNGCPRCVMIGDRYHDVEAGRANGCTVVGAAYGLPKPGELDDADVVIERFSQLVPLADRWLTPRA